MHQWMHHARIHAAPRSRVLTVLQCASHVLHMCHVSALCVQVSMKLQSVDVDDMPRDLSRRLKSAVQRYASTHYAHTQAHLAY